MLAKQLTEANCHPRYSCSKPLVIDTIFIWLSVRVLFSLTTVKNGERYFVQQRIECWSKNVFFAQLWRSVSR